MSTSSADPIVFNDNGACSWFEDERAVIDPATGTHPTNSTADDLRPIVTYTKRPVRPPSSDQSGPPA